MKWFRFYSEALHDPKVQQLRPELFKFWVNCLCLANEQPARGTLPSVAELAFILRMRRPVVERFCNELVFEQLLHRRQLDGSVTGLSDVIDGSMTGLSDVTIGYVVHQWDARQPTSDNVASRVKRYREKTSAVPPAADVTLHVTPARRTCNGPDSDSDTEKEEEKRNTPPNPPPGGEEDEEPFICPPGVPGLPGEKAARPAMPGKPHPATLSRFVELARAALGDRCEAEEYQLHIEGWLFANPDDWVRDAIGCTAVMAPRLGPGMLARYTAGCLRRWHPNGPPRNEREEAGRRLSSIADGSGGREATASPPRKETFGERRSREIDEEVAAIKAKYAATGKEADRAGR